MNDRLPKVSMDQVLATQPSGAQSTNPSIFRPLVANHHDGSNGQALSSWIRKNKIEKNETRLKKKN